MTFKEWWKDQGQYFESANYLDAKRMAKAARETAQPIEAGSISLRDKFAMAALQGMLARPAMRATIADAVEWAYEYADAMLKERMK